MNIEFSGRQDFQSINSIKAIYLKMHLILCMFAQISVQTKISFFMYGRQAFTIFFQTYSFCSLRFPEIATGKRI
jgi:hypothetical protein